MSRPSPATRSRVERPLAPLIRLTDEPAGPPPFVLVNMAMTADGRIATANRAHSRFGSRRDTEHLFALRATVDAVLCGAATLRTEDATLGPGPRRYLLRRRRAGRPAWPLRVAVSGRGSLSASAPIFHQGDSPVIVLTTESAPARRLERLRRVASEVWIAGQTSVDWPRALRRLAATHAVRRLLCEGGATLNAELFRAGLVQELHLTVCPYLVGGDQAPTIADGQGVGKLIQAARFELRPVRRQGNEVFLRFTAATAKSP